MVKRFLRVVCRPFRIMPALRRPGEDMVGLEQAFAAAEEYRPGEGTKKK
jgi:hypothetical protein